MGEMCTFQPFFLGGFKGIFELGAEVTMGQLGNKENWPLRGASCLGELTPPKFGQTHYSICQTGMFCTDL